MSQFKVEWFKANAELQNIAFADKANFTITLLLSIQGLAIWSVNDRWIIAVLKNYVDPNSVPQ